MEWTVYCPYVSYVRLTSLHYVQMTYLFIQGISQEYIEGVCNDKYRQFLKIVCTFRILGDLNNFFIDLRRDWGQEKRKERGKEVR